MGNIFTTGLHSSLDGNRITKFFPPAFDITGQCKTQCTSKIPCGVVLCLDLGFADCARMSHAGEDEVHVACVNICCRSCLMFVVSNP